MGCGGSKAKEAPPKLAKTDPPRAATVKETAAPAADNPNVAAWGKLLEAWKEGKFNDDSKTETIKQFYHEDVVIDCSSGTFAGLADLKKYTGHAGAQEWFDFVGKEQFGTPEAPPEFVCAPGPSPEILYHKYKAEVSLKDKEGKGPVHDTGLLVWTWADGKVKSLKFIYGDPTIVAALFAGDEVPVPSEPFKAPTFEPHPDPVSVWQTIYDGWSTGQMANPETKDAFFAKVFSENVFFDMKGPHEKFKKYEGFAGVDEWTNSVIGADWDMKNLVPTAVAGPQPGTVIMHMTHDLTIRSTGKSLEGVSFFFEWGIEKSGKCVYVKAYWENAAAVAALYEP